MDFSSLPESMVFDRIIEDTIEAIQGSYPLMKVSLRIIPSVELCEMGSKFFRGTVCEELDLFFQLGRLRKVRRNRRWEYGWCRYFLRGVFDLRHDCSHDERAPILAL